MKEDAVAHVTLAGDITGDYLVDERLNDGRLVLRPETAAQGSLHRLGARAATGDELGAFLDEHREHLQPADDEG